MSKPLEPDLLDELRVADACMPDVRRLGGKLAHFTAGEIEPWLSALLEAGEARVLSRLLQCSALNRIRLNPGLLCRCIGVSEELLDTAPCFAFQGAEAVAPLLEVALADEFSNQRQAYAARLAAEISIKHGLDLQPVRKLLWKLERFGMPPESGMLLLDTHHLLDNGALPENDWERIWSDMRLEEILPEQHQRVISHGEFTVRRSVPKLGRNELCHCGSNKKYKKCCYEKDQELLRDPSQYAGTTRSEVVAHPGLVDDPGLIGDLRAYELKALKPVDLGDEQLYAAYQRALTFGMRELAFEMLLAHERRKEVADFDRGHFEDLLHSVLKDGDLAVARKIRDHFPPAEWHRPRDTRFQFELLECPQRFATLEAECRVNIRGSDSEGAIEGGPLIEHAFALLPHYPALGIVFARAAIVSNPDRHFDIQILMEALREARVDLDLLPLDDPAEELCDWLEDRSDNQAGVAAATEKIDRLKARLQETRGDLEEKRRALYEMGQNMQRVGDELELAREPRPNTAAETPQIEKKTDPESRATLQRLRGQVERLQGEIRRQQEQRAQLRKQLSDEHNKQAERSTPEPPEMTLEDDEILFRQEDLDTPPLAPEYSDKFRKHCAALPPALAAKAIMAAARFATRDESIRHQTKALEQLPEHYRIRIGDYRMLLHWQPGKRLQILDIILRRDLESWIKRAL